MEKLDPLLQRIIKEKFLFSSLTPIQNNVLDKNPSLNTDILISSPTGSGKSLSYLIPVANELISSTRSQGTRALIISPTRELSVQLESIASIFSRKLPQLVAGALLSGASRQKEKARLRAGLSIVIGTPGRVVDHLENTASWNLSQLKWVIIEEADRYLCDSTARQLLSNLLSLLQSKSSRSKWKFVLVSATLPRCIPEIGGVAIEEHAMSISLVVQPDGKISHWVSPLHTKNRLTALMSLLSRWNFESTIRIPKVKDMARKPFQAILFVSTCDTVEFLFSLFSSLSHHNHRQGNSTNSLDSFHSVFLGMTIFKLHGSQTPLSRSSVISKFRAFSPAVECESFLLITTNVGARGLDFPKLKLVIQWDAPLDLDEYKHKVGRTARWQETGDAVLFLMKNEEEPVLTSLASLGEDKILPKRLEIDSSVLEPRVDKKSESFKWQRIIDDAIYSKENSTLLDLAKKAFLSSLRAYATYPALLKKAGLHPKQLHLGHYAKSFGLREAPGEIGSISTIYGSQKTKDFKKNEKKALFHAGIKRALPDEFAAC